MVTRFRICHDFHYNQSHDFFRGPRGLEWRQKKLLKANPCGYFYAVRNNEKRFVCRAKVVFCGAGGTEETMKNHDNVILD